MEQAEKAFAAGAEFGPIAIHGDYAKQKAALRHWLNGRRYYMAARALDLAEGKHTGFRKDGKTPEFAHQVWIGGFLRALSPMLPHPEQAIAIGILHDTPEDYGVTRDELSELFDKMTTDASLRLSKYRDGVKLPNEVYYAGLAEDPMAALAKGVDRTNNQGSMVGVFTREKQEEQILETKKFVLPLLKTARRRFPEYEPAFEIVKQMLVSRVALIEAIHRAADTGAV
jgi:(p)ppGpp synthase/HD superfamily hydrolase